MLQSSAQVGCAPVAVLQRQETLPFVKALRRGQFELNCPAATAQMLSRETLQPLVQNWRFQGTVRAEYTIGVSGCGQRTTYVVFCPQDGANCYPAGSRLGILGQ
ncbi:hypothetical protein [Variovorax sp. J31P207]|uniref:hypothetical protein n=1 Tax=Variovorax sp. J31P207 TaxID=3053510 RepID=UPI0025762A41|nr:hypothetical protein [Variovorax sp. J31P207]MDM0065007.1 hypothetical protein [Variovorax sp. J31P207]